MEFRDAWQEGDGENFGVGNCFCNTLKQLAV